MAEKGCFSYLTYINDNSFIFLPSLYSVRVVREFLDVFLTNLLDMPLDRDIGFTI